MISQGINKNVILSCQEGGNEFKTILQQFLMQLYC